MRVVTEEIEIPEALRRPAGMPRFERDPISEITAFDRHAGDRQRHVILALAVAGMAGLLLYGTSSKDQPQRLEIVPPSIEHVTIQKAAPEPVPVPILEEAALAPSQQLVASSNMVPIQKGKLVIESDPQVSVILGGRSLGRTPVEIELDDGLHELRLVSKGIHLDAKRKVRVQADKTRKVELSFGVAKLKVRAPKGTKVYVDDRLVGRAPLKPIRIVEGSHRLKLLHDGEQLAERLDVPAYGKIDYRARFN